MKGYSKPPLNYNADDVWAAACQAQQINGSYVKLNTLTENQLTNGVRSNREIILSLMENTTEILDESREQGLEIRKYFQGLTFKVLRGIKLSEFDNNVMVISNRDVITENFDLAVIASLPSVYLRNVERDNVDQRINFATGGYIGHPGQKATLVKLEVLKCVYSVKYNAHYVTGVTPADEVVFFSYKENIPVRQNIIVDGIVKAHRDNSTQLNRVKLT